MIGTIKYVQRSMGSIGNAKRGKIQKNAEILINTR